MELVKKRGGVGIGHNQKWRDIYLHFSANHANVGLVLKIDFTKCRWTILMGNGSRPIP